MVVSLLGYDEFFLVNIIFPRRHKFSPIHEKNSTGVCFGNVNVKILTLTDITK